MSGFLFYILLSVTHILGRGDGHKKVTFLFICENYINPEVMQLCVMGELLLLSLIPTSNWVEYNSAKIVMVLKA